MTGRQITVSLATALSLFVPAIAISQDANQKSTLIINGRSTQVTVIQVKGHPYIDLEALATAVNGSLSSGGNMIALSVPIGPAPTASPTAATNATTAANTAAAPAPAAASHQGLSKEFLNAGIEQMATLREWHTALQTAIQNGFPLSAALLAPYRTQATTNLRYAQVAVSTASDRSAFQLLNNEFQNMAKLSDKYVNARANLTYIAPDALDGDALNQRLITCGRSLGAMAASGQFSDDGSCGGS